MSIPRSVMQVPLFVAGFSAMSFVLHGCGSGDDNDGVTTVAPLTSSAPGSSGTTTSTASPASSTGTTLPKATNIWQWRSDMEMGPQITYDLSGKLDQHSIYGACWRENEPETLAGGEFVQYGPAEKQLIEDGKTYGTYDGETGLTLFNMQNTSGKPGCLMRKSRVPINLSMISRIELDVYGSGSTGEAPWYSVWLAPSIYADVDDNAKAAEIDLIENYDYLRRGEDVNNVQSAFAQCGVEGYTLDWCKNSNWGPVATALSHHITMDTTTTSEGRVIRVHRCQQEKASPMDTCDGEYAEIKVTKPPPGGVSPEKWFRVWNKDVAKDRYGMYWLVADLWWTSGTDFKLQIENVRFFKEDGSEWIVPLDDEPPSFDVDEATIV